MLLRDGHVLLAEDRPGDFRWRPEREEHSREPSTERVPSMPSVTDGRLDYTAAEVIKVERSPLQSL
jgi:hypothetical protein